MTTLFQALQQPSDASSETSTYRESTTMGVIPAEAERHVYANASDHVVKAPITSRVWVELQPGERVTYWTPAGNGAARRRRTRRRVIMIVLWIVFGLIALAGALGAASLYVQSQLG